ncbi:flavin-dependent oxidoreductase [Pontivivens ytuae]|uniref:Flavin-dependent oxidoreductase n=1 Tax=Pontivivens ytuae TaxID=2789856 RepID=A0A7S9QBQ3_9RHOB|nr:flavin-dependent oxidoreductase [Pontivivens ytuae]QPH52985.1 flavin-dependent oxidoreductase [Pontivivens ytuae]
MTVLIAGAGIGGLTLALSLHEAGVPVRVFEAVREIKPLGVGINVQPHAVRELQAMGLSDALDRVGLKTEEVAYFSSHGQLVWAEPRGLKAGYRWPQYSLHRGGLQMELYHALIERAGPEAVTTGAMVSGWVEDPDEVEVQLTDRKSGESRGLVHGSLLIGCDGINSTVRSVLYPDEGPPAWGGIMMWRGVTEGPRYRTGRTVAMTGCKRRKFVAYPIADTEGGSLINWIADLAFPPEHLFARQDWNRPGDPADILPHFADWSFDWLDVPDLIRRAESIWEYPMVDRDPLPRWRHGRVTLLGDAAHAMYPIGSNGASQTVLDARVLAREIARQGAGIAALDTYEAERREATSAIVLANRGDGPDAVLDIVEGRAPQGFERIEDVLSREELATAADGYKRIVGGDMARLNASEAIRVA